MLDDVDDTIGEAAVVQLCSSGDFPPTIAQIRETALSLSEGDVVAPSPWEAWERVLGGRVETDIEKRALKLIGGTWELRRTENQGVTRSNFVKAYNDLLTKDRQRRLAIKGVKALAASNRPPEVTPVERRLGKPEKVIRATQQQVSEMLREAGF